jgi:PAS domain-containing protein
MKTDTHLDSATILQQSAETFRLAFQTSPDAIILSRLSDAEIIDINEGCTKATGTRKRMPLGKQLLSWDSGITRAIETASLQG